MRNHVAGNLVRAVLVLVGMTVLESGIWVRQSERRRFRRTELEVPALLDAQHSWQSARCVDVSVGGLAVKMDAPLPVGTVVEVYFELPIGASVETRAEIVRTEGTRVGLRFVELGARARHVLEAFAQRSDDGLSRGRA